MNKSKMDSDQPWQELGGLTFACGADLVARRAPRLDLADLSPLAVAIRAKWPKSDASYWSMVKQRYCEFYKGILEVEAVLAVNSGYSMPCLAMNARVIKRRKYVGSKTERES